MRDGKNPFFYYPKTLKLYQLNKAMTTICYGVAI